MKVEFSGVYPMLLPFYTADDRVDRSLWRPQIEAAILHGCQGIGVMGLATEVNKLSPAERREVVADVVEILGNRLPLSVTIGENTVREQISFGKFATELGASWLILQPPPVSDVAEIELLRFFGKVADAISLPIAVQNAAMYLGVQLSPEGLVSLNRQHPNICLLKTEDPPDVTARLIDQTGGAFRLFVGRGGMDMLEGLQAGAAGIIPGMETVDRTPRIYQAVREGRMDEAKRLYHEILPTLVYAERSINHFITVSREITGARLGLPAIRHRLGKDLGEFGLVMARQFAADLGSLATEANS